jgi:DHA1 family multidrug resistance protein-like MFS transporter
MKMNPVSKYCTVGLEECESEKKRSFGEIFGFMRGNILVLTSTRVLGMFVRSMVFPYSSLFVLALGGESAQIGLINSLRPLAGLLVYPLAGYFADFGGRVKLIALSGYIQGATLLIYLFAPRWEWLLLGAFIQGFLVFRFPPSSAIVADSLPPEKRGIGIATMNTIASTFAMFSPYIAGYILSIYGDNFGMRILYGLLMVSNIVGATINLRFLKETSEKALKKIDLSNLKGVFKDVYGGILLTLGHLPRSIKALAIVIVLGFISNSVAGPFWVVYGVNNIGLSSLEWGTILLIEMALRTALYIPAGFLVDRYGRRKSMLAALLLSLISIPAFIGSTKFIDVLLIRVAIAVTNAFFVPATSALMADSVPRDVRGRVMAALGRGTVMIGASGGGGGGPGMGFVITIPVIISSILGGYLYAYNPIFPWFFVSIITLFSILVTGIFIRDPRKAEI